MTASKDPARLLLVGGSRNFRAGAGENEVYGFYGECFGRLTSEVSHLGDLTRYCGYEALRTDGDTERFLGVEVDRIATIPAGMVGWELREDSRTVWVPEAGRDADARRDTISWSWFAGTPGVRGSCTGEFTPRDETGSGEHVLTQHSYVGLHEKDTSDDSIYLVDYDSAWPRAFAEFQRYLSGVLGPETALRIEHYGSTAIPGMPAKPVIDVLVEIPSFGEARRRVIPLLNDHTWEYWWYNDHMTFVRRAKLMGTRTHHVHMAPRGHKVWEGIPFRDHLRRHPADAAGYAELKRSLAAANAHDRERYTRAKSDLVAEILARALGEAGG